jgi:16S rRNA processing protein RimM
MSGTPRAPSSPSAPADEPRLSAGWVGRHHGLDGTFHVTRPRAELLTEGATVTVDGVARRVVHRGGTAARPLLRLEGLDHISSVEPLRGKDLLVDRSALPPLDQDEFWPDQLVGVPVRSTGGAVVGAVAQVLVLPSCDVLEVRRPDADDLLVPLHRDAVPELDVAAGRVVIDLGFMGEPEPGPAGSGPSGAEPAAADAGVASDRPVPGADRADGDAGRPDGDAGEA